MKGVVGRYCCMVNKTLGFIAIALLLFGSETLGFANYALSATGTSGPPISSAAIGSAYQLFQYRLPQGSSSPWSIATDETGQVWFTEQSSNQIGMFNLGTNQFTEYNISTSNSNPLAITVDKANTVWLTALSSNKMG